MKIRIWSKTGPGSLFSKNQSTSKNYVKRVTMAKRELESAVKGRYTYQPAWGLTNGRAAYCAPEKKNLRPYTVSNCLLLVSRNIYIHCEPEVVFSLSARFRFVISRCVFFAKSAWCLYQRCPRYRKSTTTTNNNNYNKIVKSDWLSTALISAFITLHEKFMQFDWFRAVVFQLNLKYLHVKITNLLEVVV